MYKRLRNGGFEQGCYEMIETILKEKGLNMEENDKKRLEHLKTLPPDRIEDNKGNIIKIL
jgi:hypothetical protein